MCPSSSGGKVLLFRLLKLLQQVNMETLMLLLFVMHVEFISDLALVFSDLIRPLPPGQQLIVAGGK